MTTPSPGILLLVHAEVGAVVLDEHVEFLEAALVEQDAEALARGQLALGVLRGDALLAAAHPGGFAAAFEFGDIGGHRHPLLVARCLAAHAAQRQQTVKR